MSSETKVIFSGDSTGAEGAGDKVIKKVKKIGDEARLTTKELANINRELRHAGQLQQHRANTAATALRYVGKGTGIGAIDTLATSIAQSGKMGGGIIALGSAAVVASLALNALTAASERAAEQAGRVAEGQISLEHKLKSAVNNADQAAIGKAESLRALLGIGGTSAVEQAKRLESQGVLGATEGLTTLYRGNMATPAAIQAAIRATQTGQVSFEQAAGLLTQGTATTGNVTEDAMRILRNANIATQGRSIDQMAAAASGQGGNLDRLRMAQGETTAAALNRAQTRELGASAVVQDAFAAVAHPEALARREVTAAMAEQITVLNAQTEASWKLVEAIKTIGSWVGLSEANYQKLDRAVEVRRAVVGQE